MKRIYFARLVAGMVGISLISACVARAPKATRGASVTIANPMSDLSVSKGLNLEVPAGVKKAAESFMVAVVNPIYEAPVIITDPDSAGHPRKSDAVSKQYLEQVRTTMKDDMDYMLLKKGVRVLGPFSAHDEMTFDNKKRAIYVFIPKIKLLITRTHQGQDSGSAYRENGVFTVSGQITLELRESITTEKLWFKRIDAPQLVKQYRVVKDTHVQNVRNKRRSGPTIGDLIVGGMREQVEEEDDSDVALGSALAGVYMEMGRKLWDHIDPEEWGKYLSQASNLRGEKRY